MERMAESPLAIYQAHLDKGELAYQWSPEAQKVVFYPRVICPFTGSDRLEWRVGSGRRFARSTATHSTLRTRLRICELRDLLISVRRAI